MLQSLTIRNYALIDSLSIRFDRGFTIITGETGAGKSIIMGALGLILGQRAESDVLRDKENKCLVEGLFDIGGYQLQPFFDAEELDYDEKTILRREITPAGKSRAFINDTPVTLKTLRDLAVRLIDIHSQHQNLELGNKLFQLQLIDVVAGNAQLLSQYALRYKELQKQKTVLDELKETAAKQQADLDYFEFQHKQLAEARLAEHEQTELETEQNTLEHAEEIKLAFGSFFQEIDGGEENILRKLREHLLRLSKLASLLPEAQNMHQRLESCYFELKDMSAGAETIAERTVHDPDRAQAVAQRLDLLYSLQQKFRVASVAELISFQLELGEKIEQITSYDHEIARREAELYHLQTELGALAKNLSAKRKAVSGKMEQTVVAVLQKLGMPNAGLKIEVEPAGDLSVHGQDDVQFLFSANKNGLPQEISKIASGGEMSRLMLALKTLITDSKSLPTIIFDEVDAGISGEVAVKMGTILKELSVRMQVINITHLPQIAAKGDHHFFVYKQDEGSQTVTSVKHLTGQERVQELAKMLTGDQTNEALETARQLLK